MGGSPTSAPADPLGIDGYRDASLIGQGGYGSVYRATQIAFDRVVAVKVLNSDGGERGRFDAERRAIGALAGHPQIVTVLDSGTDPLGRPYIVMDHMPRGSLAQVLRNTGPFPWTEAVDVGIKLAGAVETAHRTGILHRDIKPENVLVSAYGEPKLGDFGIAQLASGSHTHTGSFAGTLAYVAPEVLNGERVTEAADVYSLAATIYSLIEGAAPFTRSQGEPLAALVARIVSVATPHLSAEVPHDINAALLQALTKDPSTRTAGAAEFGAALQRAQEALALPITEMYIDDSGESFQIALRSADDDELTIRRAHSLFGPKAAARSIDRRRVAAIAATAAVTVAALAALTMTFIQPNNANPPQRQVAAQDLSTPAPTPTASEDDERIHGEDDRRTPRAGASRDERGRERRGRPIVVAAGTVPVPSSDAAPAEPAPDERRDDAGSSGEKRADQKKEQEDEIPPNYPLYHLHNPETDDHYYTYDSSDRAYKMAVGYEPVRVEGYMYKRKSPRTIALITNDGIVGYIWHDNEPGTVPLYFLKNEDHKDLFTSDEAARDAAIEEGWRLVSIYGYITPR